jgi:hypothetical protein
VVDIRSASYTSSYSSPTLTIPTPSDMQPGDFLLCFLIALSKYSGNFYTKGALATGVIVGTPPPGWTLDDSGPTLPHDAPVAVLHKRENAMLWTTPTDSGYLGCWWSNLGVRLDNGDWVTTGLSTWPWQSSWTGTATASSPVFSSNTGCMASITAVGRLVGGSSPALVFTLNIPNDSEYDYRGIALCLSGGVDWGGTYYDTPLFGGFGLKNFNGPESGWSTTGTRSGETVFDDDPGVHAAFVIGAGEYASAGGGHHYGINLRDLVAYFPQSQWGLSDWPPDTDYVADSSSPVAGYADAPPDDLDADDLILHLIAYAGDASFGDPSDVVVSDQTATPAVSPLSMLHEESWSKSPNTLMVRLSQTRPTSNHASEAGGSGIVTITSPIVVPEGPISVPAVTWDTDVDGGIDQIYGVGLALTFRVRRAYPVPVLTAVPSRLATIVG